MKRVIKFRAWDGKRMLYSERYDFYLVPNNKVQIPSSTGHEFYEKEYPIMQFTGLHDKNGKEIYEGDIIYSERSNNKYVVVFKNGSFRGEQMPESMAWVAPNDLINHNIIGNIHEHPHLLNQ